MYQAYMSPPMQPMYVSFQQPQPGTTTPPSVAEDLVKGDRIPTNEAVAEAASQPTKPSGIVYVNALLRLIMGPFLIAAGSLTRPVNFLKTKHDPFYECAICFCVGTGCFFLAALIDVIGSLKNGVSSYVNASLYPIGALVLFIGSVFFIPEVSNKNNYEYASAAVGQWCYIIGTLIVIAALLMVSQGSVCANRALCKLRLQCLGQIACNLLNQS